MHNSDVQNISKIKDSSRACGQCETLMGRAHYEKKRREMHNKYHHMVDKKQEEANRTATNSMGGLTCGERQYVPCY